MESLQAITSLLLPHACFSWCLFPPTFTCSSIRHLLLPLSRCSCIYMCFLLGVVFILCVSPSVVFYCYCSRTNWPSGTNKGLELELMVYITHSSLLLHFVTVCFLQTDLLSPLIQKYWGIKLIRVWTLDTWWRLFWPVMSYKLLQPKMSCWLHGDIVVSAWARTHECLCVCMKEMYIAGELGTLCTWKQKCVMSATVKGHS